MPYRRIDAYATITGYGRVTPQVSWLLCTAALGYYNALEGDNVADFNQITLYTLLITYQIMKVNNDYETKIP